MEIEVVYMVGHDDQPGTRYYRQQRRSVASTAPREGQEREPSSSSSDGDPEGEGEQMEEPTLLDTVAILREQKQMQRQIKEKDDEISQLNAKMNQIMAQMDAMMQMMQKGVATGQAHVPPADQQISSGVPPNPPTNQVPQTSEVHDNQNRGAGVNPVTPQLISQAIPSTSEPLTTAQLETFIHEKMKAVIALEQAEKLVCRGRPYPI